MELRPKGSALKLSAALKFQIEGGIFLESLRGSNGKLCDGWELWERGQEYSEEYSSVIPQILGRRKRLPSGSGCRATRFSKSGASQGACAPVKAGQIIHEGFGQNGG